MKRRVGGALCLALLICLCALAGAEEEGAAWRLTEIDLWPEGIEDRGYWPISVSPDGEAVLWKKREWEGPGDDTLFVSRDGRVMPFVKAEDRGAEDIYGRLEIFLACGNTLPGGSGVSWTPDGRYAVMSPLEEYQLKFIPYDPVILDTWTGEAFLAAAYPGTDILDDEEFVTVQQAHFSADGRYLYYSLLSNPLSDGAQYAWLRYSMETGETETLVTAAIRNWKYYTGHSGLFEMPDGGWVTLLGSTPWIEALRPGEGGQWRRQLTPLQASPQSRIARLTLSASGRGVVQSQYMFSCSYFTQLQYTENGVQNLGDWGFGLEVSEQGFGDTQLAPLKWSGGQPQLIAPEGTEGTFIPITGVRLCLSPNDSRALVFLPMRSYGHGQAIALLDLDTMTMSPVAVPEGTLNVYPTPDDSVYYFYPGMVWEENDTVLMLLGESVKAFRLERAEGN